MDTAFDQIRHYATADLAVSLRLIRAFHDIARVAKQPNEREHLLALARRVVAASSIRLSESELARLKQRVAYLEAYAATEK